MCANFDGKPYTRDEFAAHVAGLTFTAWKPAFIVLHNTGSPSLQQWLDGGATPAQRIANLQHYYELNEHWHAGPHLFVDPEHIWGFSDLTKPGVHASCFNRVAIGIEMVGDYGSEAFDPYVRDNAVFALAVLHHKLGIRPDGLVYGKSGLHFHRDCARDRHACPGAHVDRGDMVARVLAQMAALARRAPPPVRNAPQPIPSAAGDENPLLALGAKGIAVEKLQARLNARPGAVRLQVDGRFGKTTQAEVSAFQRSTGLESDGIVGQATWQALLAAPPAKAAA